MKNIPKSKKIPHLEKNIPLIVPGQGIFLFNNNDNTKDCVFYLKNNEGTDGFNVQFTLEKVVVSKISTGELLNDDTNEIGLIDKKGAYYWFCLDSQNLCLSAGIGEARVNNIIYNYQFEADSKEKYHEIKLFLETITKINIDDVSESLEPLKIIRDPITTLIPLKVKRTDELSMDDIASNSYMPKSFLSTVGQKLFDCVSGENFILDTDDFPDFSKAIEYSIATPGCWCHEKIKEKSTEFNPSKPNIFETYLRITLGQNNGESPGVPYVMEIWPVGHYSPIHNHANTNAIIRVLHGSINVSLYAFLCEDEEGISPFARANFGKDDITWITPSLNQTHQLKNLESNTDTCITIQCYMYDNEDDSHYDYFDYIDADGKKQQYEPDSDMDYLAFKQIIKEEWENRENNEKDKSLTETVFDYFKYYLGYN